MFVSNGSPSSVVVNVNYGVPSGRYGIEFRAGSAAKHLGTVSIRDERGAWGGVVALPGGATGSVVLVGADGAVVCEARLSPAT